MTECPFHKLAGELAAAEPPTINYRKKMGEAAEHGLDAAIADMSEAEVRAFYTAYVSENFWKKFLEIKDEISKSASAIFRITGGDYYEILYTVAFGTTQNAMAISDDLSPLHTEARERLNQIVTTKPIKSRMSPFCDAQEHVEDEVRGALELFFRLCKTADSLYVAKHSRPMPSQTFESMLRSAEFRTTLKKVGGMSERMAVSMIKVILPDLLLEEDGEYPVLTVPNSAMKETCMRHARIMSLVPGLDEPKVRCPAGDLRAYPGESLTTILEEFVSILIEETIKTRAEVLKPYGI